MREGETEKRIVFLLHNKNSVPVFKLAAPNNLDLSKFNGELK